jgi:hypothetical protein
MPRLHIVGLTILLHDSMSLSNVLNIVLRSRRYSLNCVHALMQVGLHLVMGGCLLKSLDKGLMHGGRINNHMINLDEGLGRHNLLH